MDGKKQDGGRGRLSCDVIPVEALVQPRGSSVAEMTHWSHPRWGREDRVFILQVGLLSCVHAQSLNLVRLFATPWTAAYQVSLSFTISQSLLKLMSIELVIPSNHLILCHPLLRLLSIFPITGVFSNESAHQVTKVLELQLQH